MKGGFRPNSGRPARVFEQGLSRLLQIHFDEQKRANVIQTLYLIAVDKSKTNRRNCIAAASLLFAYTYGKPTERVEVTKIDGRDAQVNSARTSYVLAAIPAIQAQNPEWNAEQVTQEAELQFDAWMASLQADRPALIDVESTA